MPSSSATAAALLKPLVGQTIYTITSRMPNEIIGLDADDVIVTTAHGTDHIPLAQLDMALEVLRREGEVRITPDAFPDRAFRSSFVGAALAQIEGVQVLTSPQRVRLRPRTSVSALFERACTEVALPRTTARYSGDDPFALLMVQELRDAVEAHIPGDGS
jgi:hypothetical protein